MLHQSTTSHATSAALSPTLTRVDDVATLPGKGHGTVQLLRTLYWILRAEWPLFTLIAVGWVLLLAVGHLLTLW
jgi:hypothetical protein